MDNLYLFHLLNIGKVYRYQNKILNPLYYMEYLLYFLSHMLNILVFYLLYKEGNLIFENFLVDVNFEKLIQ